MGQMGLDAFTREANKSNNSMSNFDCTCFALIEMTDPTIGNRKVSMWAIWSMMNDDSTVQVLGVSLCS